MPKTVMVECPVCGSVQEIESEYESADTSVGIMAGGFIFPEDMNCDECKHVFSPEEIRKAEDSASQNYEEGHNEAC